MNRIINIICFTPNGGKVAARIKKELNNDLVKTYAKSSSQIDDCQMMEEGLDEFAKEAFENSSALIVVGATGIATRMIACCLKDKLTDIPVIVIDELADYVIPILSGHAGGANDLSRELAKILEAIPVITTATDVNDKYAVDVFAIQNGLDIVNKDGIKLVSKKVLSEKPLTISIKNYPSSEAVDIAITDKPYECEASLYLKPKRYVLGVGCRQGKSFEELKTFTGKLLKEYSIEPGEVYLIASIDRKSEEEGIIRLAASMKIPFVTFENTMLEKVKGDFSASDFVNKTVGVDNVCERSAVLAAGSNAKLLVKKTTENGMSLALASRF